MRFLRILSILLNFIFIHKINSVHIIVNNFNAQYIYPLFLTYPIIKLNYDFFFESENKTLDVK